MKKKGVELSMNLIIIAAIGLLILVILAVLVINAGGKTSNAMASCNLKGGLCGQCTQDRIIPANEINPPCGSGTSCCRVAIATGT